MLDCNKNSTNVYNSNYCDSNSTKRGNNWGGNDDSHYDKPSLPGKIIFKEELRWSKYKWAVSIYLGGDVSEHMPISCMN